MKSLSAQELVTIESPPDPLVEKWRSIAPQAMLVREEAERYERLSNAVYVHHAGHNVNDSCFMWFSPCERFVIDFRTLEKDTGTSAVRVCKDASVIQLLEPFCQRLELVEKVTNATYMAIGVYLQSLFRAYDPETEQFNAAKLDPRIRSVQKCDYGRQCLRLSKKYGGQPVSMNIWGGRILAHDDHAMEEVLGVVQWSIQGLSRDSWAFTVMIDVNNELYQRDITAAGLSMSAVLAATCDLFIQSLAYLKDVSYHSEASQLLHSIGRIQFESSTVVTSVGDVFENQMMETNPVEATAAADAENGSASVLEDGSQTKTVFDALETNPETKIAKSKVKKKPKKNKKKSKAKDSPAQTGDLQSDDEPEVTTDKVTAQGQTIPAPASVSKQQSDEGPATRKSGIEDDTKIVVTAEKKASSTPIQPDMQLIPTSMSATLPISSTGQPVFRFNVPTLHLKCRHGPCFHLADASNPTTTLCPRCGIFSYVRYCSLAHMQADLRRHFSGSVDSVGPPECGRMTIPIAIDELTLGSPAGPVRRFINEEMSGATGAFPKDIIERHRQAVYRSMSETEDYFIFDDVDRLAVPHARLSRASRADQIGHLNRVRGTGQVCATIAIPSADKRRQMFNQLLDDCLALGSAAGTLAREKCEVISDVIIGELKARGQWDGALSSKLCTQFGFEFQYRIPDHKLVLDDGDHGEALEDIEE